MIGWAFHAWSYVVGDDIFASASILASAIREKRITCADALEWHLDRIERLNPDLNAVIAMDVEGARERARAADAALAAGEVWGPLHGVPMTVKDTYEVAGMATVCGEPSLAHYHSERDAVAVQRLRAAGAIIFGKTNTPRFAQDIQTFNKVFGTTNNPWDTTRTPGGSSGGAAAATAAGFTAFELGSDIGGSIRTPAHWCGVYGHKPSHGIIPLEGHIPGPPGTVSEPDLATPGPLARAPEDLSLALDLLAGAGTLANKAWQLTLPAPRHDKLADFRVACWFDDEFCPVDSETKRLLGEAADALRGTGAAVDTNPELPFTMATAFGLYQQLLNAVIGAGIPPKLYRKAQRAASFFRLVGRTKAGALSGFVDTATQTFKQWAGNNERRQRERRDWEQFFENYDVLLMPVTPTAAIPHQQAGSLFSRTIDVDGTKRPYFDQFVWIAPATSALLPVTVAPIGQTATNLPIGMQIVGPYLEDHTTITFAGLLAEQMGGFVSPPGHTDAGSQQNG